MGIFVTPPKSDVQKGAMAYTKESSKSKTYILLLSEIGWGAVLNKLRLVFPIEMYRHVAISLVTPMTLAYLLCYVILYCVFGQYNSAIYDPTLSDRSCV